VKLLRAMAAAMAILLAAMGAATAEGVYFALSLPIAVWALAGVFTGEPDLFLEAQRSVSSLFPEPDTNVEIRLRVTNKGGRIERLVLVDPLPLGAALATGNNEWAGSLHAGTSTELRYSVSLHRGVFRFDKVEAMCERLISATSCSISLSCPAIVTVPPKRIPAPELPFGPRAVRPFLGMSRTKRVGEGTDFACTRDYAPGDRLRALNWRAEAMWDKPVVNVFEGEKAVDVGIILDSRAEAYEDPEIFESSVQAAAAAADRLLNEGNRVAFLSYGSTIEWTPSGAGRAQRLKIRKAAAQASLGAHAAFEHFTNIPVELFPPRSVILVVSPLLRADVIPLRGLKALGYAVTVLRPWSSQGCFKRSVPDPSEWSASAPAMGSSMRRPLQNPSKKAEFIASHLLTLENDVLLSRLLRGGVEIFAWDCRFPFTSAILFSGKRV
jgi:uncharacterized protein (DUF58 family)